MAVPLVPAVGISVLSGSGKGAEEIAAPEKST
jgi:hypothetical protein